MNSKKIVKWVKEHKKLAVLSILGIATGTFGIYYFREMNRVGSNIWIKHATVDQLENYREDIGYIYQMSGLFNLSNNQFNTLENLLYKLDDKISELRWENMGRDFNIPYTEHGWYLPESE